MNPLLKRVGTTLLAAALMVGTLAGCQSSGQKEKTPADGKTAEIPEVYYQGFIAMRTGEHRNPSSDEVIAEMQEKVIEEIGVKPVPVFMPVGSETEKLNIMIASADEKLDVIMDGDWMDLSSKGLIIPLNDYIAKSPNINNVYPTDNDAWLMLKDKSGKIWGLPRALPTTSYPIWIRQDWLDKLGLKQPNTVDEYEAILKAFKENDPAGNGQTIPVLTDIAGLKMGLSAGYTEKGYGNFLDTDGKLKPSILAPGFKDAVAKMADWYKNGYIHKEAFTVTYQQQIEQVTSNRVGSTLNWYSLVAINQPNLRKTVSTADYQYNPVINGPTGTIMTSGGPSTASIKILKKCKNPEAAMKFLDWLSNTDNYVSSYLGVQGKDWHYSNPDKKYVIRDDTQRYGGEFYVYPNVAMIKTYTIMPDDNTTEPDIYNEYLTVGSYRYDQAKKPDDYGLIYPKDVMDKIAPNRADVTKMIDTELPKFVTGARPMSDWDKFAGELDKAGMQKLIEAQTKVYNDWKK